jgi:hypothetical protein
MKRFFVHRLLDPFATLLEAPDKILQFFLSFFRPRGHALADLRSVTRRWRRPVTTAASMSVQVRGLRGWTLRLLEVFGDENGNSL